MGKFQVRSAIADDTNGVAFSSVIFSLLFFFIKQSLTRYVSIVKWRTAGIADNYFTNQQSIRSTKYLQLTVVINKKTVLFVAAW